VSRIALADPFHIIAHRGASGYAPENTMAAFERAVAMGATEVETDVSLTSDGQLLLLHDETLDRTTNGHGDPRDFTLAQLKQLDAGSWHDDRLSWDRSYAGEPLITLDELLDRFGASLTYHIELKQPQDGLVPAVVGAIARRGLAGRCFVFAIEQEAELVQVKRLAADIRIAWAPEAMLGTNPMAAVEQCARNQFTMIVLNAQNQTRDLVAHAHALGIEARSSGISTREKMIGAAEIGCNGMTINWPDWLLDFVHGDAAQ
jgi:glycerophosphoryl diester phosphodiesterase